MTRKNILIFIALLLAGCAVPDTSSSAETPGHVSSTAAPSDQYASMQEDPLINVGTTTDRGMIVDNTYHDPEQGDLHFSSYIPDSYDGSEAYALFITNPGWEGEYFQGVGANLGEPFSFEARKYNDRMIILSTQLDGWDEDSARDSLALTHHFLDYYNIDPDKLYLHGHSGGGETVSWELNLEPQLFTRAMMTSSQFDGDIEPLVQAETPLYLAIVQNDAWYTEKPFEDIWQKLHDAYAAEGKSEEDIRNLAVLDVRDSSFGQDRGATNTHGAGEIFAYDETAMNWLFQ